MSALRRVSPREALALVESEGFVYLDVRTIPEFEAGHPAGAYNVPFAHPGASGMEPNAEFLDTVRQAFGPETKMVLGCQAGGRSLRAAELLLGAGFPVVVDQRAGWGGVRDPFGRITEQGWQREGLPSASEAEPGRSYEALRVRRR